MQAYPVRRPFPTADTDRRLTDPVGRGHKWG